MTCAFDLDHYRELLDAARTGGYRFAPFHDEPRAGDVYLRHDVDLSLEAALTLARLEHERGVHATYFLMTESVFYNLGSAAGCDALAELRGLEHRVGLHAVYPRAAHDERFDRVLAWHNPDPDYVHEAVPGLLNVMEPPWFTQGHYRSDSNQHWREGCPHGELREGRFEWLQLLTHPEIWVYEGETMGDTMRTMAQRRQEELLEQLVNDRIDIT